MKYGEVSTNVRLKLDCKLKKKRRVGFILNSKMKMKKLINRIQKSPPEFYCRICGLILSANGTCSKCDNKK